MFVRYQRGRNNSRGKLTNTSLSIEIEDEPEYTSDVYEEIHYSEMEKQDEYEGIVEITYYSESPQTPNENSSFHAVSKATEDESQSHYKGKVAMTDYTDCYFGENPNKSFCIAHF